MRSDQEQIRNYNSLSTRNFFYNSYFTNTLECHYHYYADQYVQ